MSKVGIRIVQHPPTQTPLVANLLFILFTTQHTHTHTRRLTRLVTALLTCVHFCFPQPGPSAICFQTNIITLSDDNNKQQQQPPPHNARLVFVDKSPLQRARFPTTRIFLAFYEQNSLIHAFYSTWHIRRGGHHQSAHAPPPPPFARMLLFEGCFATHQRGMNSLLSIIN